MPARPGKSMTEALLALGGNVGDSRAILDRAVALLCDGHEVRLTARSSDYRTPPWGIVEQPPFVNLCIAVETTLDARALLARAHAVERQLGRDRANETRNGPRTADIDIVAYGDLTLDAPEPDATPPAPVRARLRAGAAGGDRARSPHRRRARGGRGGEGRLDRRRKAAATLVALHRFSCGFFVRRNCGDLICPFDRCVPLRATSRGRNRAGQN